MSTQLATSTNMTVNIARDGKCRKEKRKSDIPAVTMSLLDSMAAVSSDGKKDSDGFECSICLDSPTNVKNVATIRGCGHRFCFGCIQNWAKAKQGNLLCPLCKKEFNKIIAEGEECDLLVGRVRCGRRPKRGTSEVARPPGGNAIPQRAVARERRDSALPSYMRQTKSSSATVRARCENSPRVAEERLSLSRALGRERRTRAVSSYMRQTKSSAAKRVPKRDGHSNNRNERRMAWMNEAQRLPTRGKNRSYAE
mmetsp:Transcript_36841/g.77292  ORF Transcript_36841/g.77292 Transcript_36841/m.77292 type:complete len:253 (+) Transcript_36841:686-1444(+)